MNYIISRIGVEVIGFLVRKVILVIANYRINADLV